MPEIAKVGSKQISLLALGTVLVIAVPLVIAIVWKIKKKEKFTTVVTGAVTFLLFALILEKPIQNVLIFPTQMGLSEHALSRFIDERPVLWAFIVGLFPGVFEETGRFIAFKTVLKKRKNRETSVSYGIGHGGFEVMLILGANYITYIAYALIINAGQFETLVKQIESVAPDQLNSLYNIAAQIAAFSASDLCMGIVERISAVLFHIGASVIVFYACRDRNKIWLYPLAIALHTAMDFTAGLFLVHLINPPVIVFEGIIGIMGFATFFGAYFLLYKKEQKTFASPGESKKACNQ